MATPLLETGTISFCAMKRCERLVNTGQVICSGCVDVLDGLLDEVEHLYPFLTLLINRTFSKGAVGGVVDNAVNLSALDAVAAIDRVVTEMADHVITKTMYVDFPRDADGNIFDGVGMVTAYDVPLPMGGEGCATLRKVVWLRSSKDGLNNLDVVAGMTSIQNLLAVLRSSVNVAENMVTSKAGAVLLGSCRHCMDERDLWIEKGAQGAVCRSCWKMNTLRENFLSALESGKSERLMTAPGISKAMSALGIRLTAETIASWDANECRRVKSGVARGKEVVNRFPVKKVEVFAGNRERKLFAFEDAYSYWHRLNEERLAKLAKKTLVTMTEDDDLIFEVTVK